MGKTGVFLMKKFVRFGSTANLWRYLKDAVIAMSKERQMKKKIERGRGSGKINNRNAVANRKSWPAWRKGICYIIYEIVAQTKEGRRIEKVKRKRG